MRKGYLTLSIITAILVSGILFVMGILGNGFLENSGSTQQNPNNESGETMGGGGSGGIPGGGGGGGGEMPDSKDITIQLNDESKEYDGKPLYFEDFIITDGRNLLEKGSYIDLGLETAKMDDISITEIGTKVVTQDELDIKIFNQYKKDITEKYNLIVEPATLEIKPITLKTFVRLPSKTYDGEAYEIDEPGCYGNLLPNHHLEATLTNSMIDAGTYIADVEYTVLDIEKNDASKYYNIEPVGNYFVEILPAEFSINVKDIVREYTGDEVVIKSNDYEINKIDQLDGMNVSLSHNGGIYTEIGKYKIKPVFKVIDNKGDDVTANFKIIVNTGNLEITKRKIKVNPTIGSNVKVYDGKAFGTLTEDLLDITGSSLLPGHTITATPTNTDMIECGSYSTDLNFSIVDRNRRDVSSIYIIENFDQSFGFTINNSVIEIKAPDLSVTYDGQTSYYSIISTFIIDYYNKTGIQLTAESVLPYISLESVDSGTVNYKLSSFDTNYIVESTIGTLTIKPKNINVYLPNKTFTYSKIIVQESEKYILNYLSSKNSKEIADGLTLKDGMLFDFIDRIGSFTLDGDFFNSTLNSNYELIFMGGKINVIKGSLNVSVNYHPDIYTVKTYDGSKFVLPADSIVLSGLDKSDYIINSVTINETIYTVADLQNYGGRVTVAYIDAIYKDKGTRITEYYDLNYGLASQTIEPIYLYKKRNVTVMLPDLHISSVDDVTDTMVKGIVSSAIRAQLAPGDEVSVVYYNENEISKGDLIISNVTIKNSRGQNVTSCYSGLNRISGRVIFDA